MSKIFQHKSQTCRLIVLAVTNPPTRINPGTSCLVQYYTLGYEISSPGIQFEGSSDTKDVGVIKNAAGMIHSIYVTLNLSTRDKHCPDPLHVKLVPFCTSKNKIITKHTV